MIDNQATKDSRDMNAHPKDSQHNLQQLADHKENTSNLKRIRAGSRSGGKGEKATTKTTTKEAYTLIITFILIHTRPNFCRVFLHYTLTDKNLLKLRLNFVQEEKYNATECVDREGTGSPYLSCRQIRLYSY